jgi:hypothetical protein
VVGEPVGKRLKFVKWKCDLFYTLQWVMSKCREI